MIFPFRQYSPKIILAFAALLWFGLLIFYYYQRDQVQQAASERLSWQQQTQRLARLQANNPVPTSLSLPFTIVLEQSATQQQLTLTLKPVEGKGIDVTLPPMQFQQLIAWLAGLQREHGIRVQALQVSALASPGMIRIEVLRLQRLSSH